MSRTVKSRMQIFFLTFKNHPIVYKSIAFFLSLRSIRCKNIFPRLKNNPSLHKYIFFSRVASCVHRCVAECPLGFHSCLSMCSMVILSLSLLHLEHHVLRSIITSLPDLLCFYFPFFLHIFCCHCSPSYCLPN